MKKSTFKKIIQEIYSGKKQESINTKSRLNSFIKETINSILKESPNLELENKEELNTDHVISAFKRNNVSDETRQLLFRAYKEGDISAETVIKIVSDGMDETTIETSPEDLDKIKDKVDDEDTIRIIGEDEEDSNPNKTGEYPSFKLLKQYPGMEWAINSIFSKKDYGHGYTPNDVNFDSTWQQNYFERGVKMGFYEEVENLNEDEEVNHQSAERGAITNQPKSNKLNATIEALEDIKKGMKTLVNQYKKAEGEDKQKYIQQLKVKTKIKSELESLIQKLEKNVV